MIIGSGWERGCEGNIQAPQPVPIPSLSFEAYQPDGRMRTRPIARSSSRQDLECRKADR